MSNFTLDAFVAEVKLEVNEKAGNETLLSSVASNVSDGGSAKAIKESLGSTGNGSTIGNYLSVPSRRTYSIRRVPSKKRKKFNIDNQNHHEFSKEGSSNQQSTLVHEQIDPKVHVAHPPKKFHFLLQESLEQPTKDPIYSLTISEPQNDFNFDNDDGKNTENNKSLRPTTTRLLATCSTRNLVLYRITEDEVQQAPISIKTTASNNANQDGSIDTECSNMIHLVHCFTDQDPNEEYYTCTFVGPPSPQLVCVGGKNARIHVIDCIKQSIVRTLSGHGSEIYDLKTCPTNEWLLLSASKDFTCRLWNLCAINTSPVAIFGGHNGHCDAVTTISWHILGHQFVSGGLDNTIKIWEISDRVLHAISSSNDFTDTIRSSTETIDQCNWLGTALIQFPVFSTKRVHAHCVDCVMFLGDLVLSKSIENLIHLWYPIIQNETTPFGDIIQPPSSAPLILHTYQFDEGDIWFVRFAVEPTLKLLAMGNILGKIFIWNIGNDRSLNPICKLNIRRTSTIRCLCFSPDGSMLLASTDDGFIYQWILTIE
jgi:polycomb protein EED